MEHNYSHNNNSYMKIFRPWAVSTSQEQDATISTTSDQDEQITNTQQEPTTYKVDIKYCSEFKEEKLTRRKESTPEKDSIKCNPEIMPSSEWYSLGSTDALLLEAASLAHGISHGRVADEYARVLLGEERRARLSAAARKQRPKKYKCPHCDVGFSNNGQLKGHIRIHTGERPFRCDAASCGKTFTRNEELTRHKRIHSGLRPFPCQECGKRFGRKDHLKKHARTHVQHRAAALYGAVPLVPVLFPPVPPAFMDPWTFLPPPHIPPLYGY